MTERTHLPRPRIYRKHSPYVWDAVRRDYLAGYTISECAERHGVGSAIIYWRSREHGWREERDAMEAARHGDLEAPTPTTGPHYAPGGPLSPLPPQRFASASPLEPLPPRHPAPVQEASEPPEPLAPDDAARQAFKRSARAMADGRPQEAQAWARLAKGLGGLRLDGEPADAADRAPGRGGGDRPFVPTYKPGEPTPFDKLNAIAEKRLDQLLHFLWHGNWDERAGLPVWGIDRDGQICRIADYPGAWLDIGARGDRPTFADVEPPFSCNLPVPSIVWLLDVWVPDWNARHPDDPCTPERAMMIHGTFTADPKSRANYDGPEITAAREAWDAARAAMDPDSDEGACVIMEEDARAEDARRRREAERTKRRAMLDREWEKNHE